MGLPVRLAKDHLDVGLFTNRRQDQLDFWQQTVGLEFDHLAKLGGGVHQLRHHVNGSILKLNNAREPLPAAPPSGYRELLIARPGLSVAETLQDPDGNRVVLVPPGQDGVAGIAMRMMVRDLAAARRFWVAAMQFDDIDATTVRCGDTLLLLTEDPGMAPVGDWHATGYRYLTVQVWDCDSEHAAALARGATEGRPPRTVGTTARYSFVRDPDGNWIEISQRAQLTGSLD